MASLAVNVLMENGTRLIAGRPVIDDDAKIMTVPVELRTLPATDYLISRRVLTIQNAPVEGQQGGGPCDRVVRVVPPAGSNIEEKLSYQAGALLVPNGFDRALAAWAGGGAGAGGKRAALLAELGKADFGAVDPATLAMG